MNSGGSMVKIEPVKLIKSEKNLFAQPPTSKSFADKVKEVLNKSNNNSNNNNPNSNHNNNSNSSGPIKNIEEFILNYISRCLSSNLIPDINKIYEKKELDFLNVYKNQDTYEDQIKVIKNNEDIFKRIKEKESKYHRIYTELNDEREKMKQQFKSNIQNEIGFLKSNNNSNRNSNNHNSGDINRNGSSNKINKNDYSIYTDQYLSKDEMINKREVEKALKTSTNNGKILLKCNYDKKTESNILNLERIDNKTNLLNKKRHENALVEKLKKGLNLTVKHRNINSNLNANKSGFSSSQLKSNNNLLLNEKNKMSVGKTLNSNKKPLGVSNNGLEKKGIDGKSLIKKKNVILPKKTILSNVNEPKKENELIISKLSERPKFVDNERKSVEKTVADKENVEKSSNTENKFNSTNNNNNIIKPSSNSNNLKNKLNMIKQEREEQASSKLNELKEQVKNFVKSNSNNKPNKDVKKRRNYYEEDEDDYVEDDFVVKDEISKKYLKNNNNKRRYEHYSDEDDVMEVGFDEIEKEEARTARIGDEEDYKEYLKEKMKKKKMLMS